MRKRQLIALLLFCLLTAGALGCSSDESAQAAGDEGEPLEDAITTTTLPPTTTTLAPATWEKIAPESDVPPARLGGSMVYVSANEILLFGGWDGDSTYYSDLWSYDPATDTWNELEPASEPPPGRASQAVAYDPAGRRLILFGGYDGGTYYGDAWEYDLADETWSPLASAGSTPRARYGHSLVYDPESKKMILFGGYGGTAQYGDTWAYDPATNVWTDLKPAGDTPAARDSQAMVYDPDERLMVLFGGWSSTNMFDDTWAYVPAENVWLALTPTGGPPLARALHQMVYDESIKKCVMFGGGTSSATYDDAWLFDANEISWTRASADGEPPSTRAGHAMVYDPSTRRVLVFGGSNGVDSYLNDLWRLTR